MPVRPRAAAGAGAVSPAVGPEDRDVGRRVNGQVQVFNACQQMDCPQPRNDSQIFILVLPRAENAGVLRMRMRTRTWLKLSNCITITVFAHAGQTRLPSGSRLAAQQSIRDVRRRVTGILGEVEIGAGLLRGFDHGRGAGEQYHGDVGAWLREVDIGDEDPLCDVCVSQCGCIMYIFSHR